MFEILPNTPVVFEDGDGLPHWGLALSPIIPTAMKTPWPHVLIRIVGVREPVKVPARDVDVWWPGVAVLQARTAAT